jgi:hypothetical protein
VSLTPPIGSGTSVPTADPPWRSSMPGDINDGVGERPWCFLRQIMARPFDDSERTPVRELRGGGRMRRPTPTRRAPMILDQAARTAGCFTASTSISTSIR